MKAHKYIFYIALPLLSACSFVDLTEEGSAIDVVTDAAKVEACKKIATTTSSVLDKVGFMDRTDRAMVDELTMLARNKAAKIGGDTVVPKGTVEEGSMSFDIYNCGGALK